MAKKTYDRKYTSLETPMGLTGVANMFRESDFGGYSITMFFESDNMEAAEFFKSLEEIYNTNLEHELEGNPKLRAYPLQSFEVRDNDPEQFRDGNYLRVTLKTKTPPTVIDTNGNTVNLTHEVPIGSTARARVNAVSWNYGGKTGTSFYVNALQIAQMPEKKKKTTGRKTEHFGKIEGSFVGLGTNTEDIGLD